MIDYEAGSIPSKPMTIVVRDELDNPVSLIGYTSIRLEMLGQDGEMVDLNGVLIEQIPNVIGGLTVTWPRNKSLFERKGIYTIRLVCEGDGARDITRTGEIKVREFGRIK